MSDNPKMNATEKDMKKEKNNECENHKIASKNQHQIHGYEHGSSNNFFRFPFNFCCCRDCRLWLLWIGIRALVCTLWVGIATGMQIARGAGGASSIVFSAIARSQIDFDVKIIRSRHNRHNRMARFDLVPRFAWCVRLWWSSSVERRQMHFRNGHQSVSGKEISILIRRKMSFISIVLWLFAGSYFVRYEFWCPTMCRLLMATWINVVEKTLSVFCVLRFVFAVFHF